MTNYTENLARYIANVQYSDIPEEVIDRAKKLTMHCVGATLAALPSISPALMRAIKSLRYAWISSVELSISVLQ